MELDQFFENYDLNIVQSTGEFREHDLDIQFGHVDIAVMITEKVFNYLRKEHVKLIGKIVPLLVWK